MAASAQTRSIRNAAIGRRCEQRRCGPCAHGLENLRAKSTREQLVDRAREREPDRTRRPGPRRAQNGGQVRCSRDELEEIGVRGHGCARRGDVVGPEHPGDALGTGAEPGPYRTAAGLRLPS